MNKEEMIQAIKDGKARELDLTNADLRMAKLFGTDLVFTDLYGADLTGADLQVANLSYADLTEANLRGADLRWTDLRGANLKGADLTYVTGNGREIKTFILEGYIVNITKDIIQISNKQFPVNEYVNFSDNEFKYYCMLDWAKKWNDLILKTINNNSNLPIDGKNWANLTYSK